MMTEVPGAERSDPLREEHVHFRASDVAWMEATGPTGEAALEGGWSVILDGELWRALEWFEAMGHPFIRTHRQVVVRADRCAGVEQA